MIKWLWGIWAILGALAVGMASMIAHLFPPEIRYFLEAANKIHFFHLIPTAIILYKLEQAPNKLLLTSLILFALGYLFFPFAIYVKYTFNITSASKLAPYGGYSLILAWLTLAAGFIVKRKEPQ